MQPLTKALLLRAFLIGVSLSILRLIADEFRIGTTTETHPVGLLITVLLGSGFIWLSLIRVLKKHTLDNDPKTDPRALILWAFVLGIGFRALFIGSTPIYEDDWNRYLWDGVVITQGISPYVYSPEDISEFQTNDVVNDNSNKSDLQKLSTLSKNNHNFVERINNPSLTTIYPPISQSVFTLAALVKPLSLDPLRAFYLLSEILVFVLLLKALQMFNRSGIWLWLYSLNPILIFTAFNGAHMDILLVPFVLFAIIFIAKRPILAALALACAVGVKLWPLILAPILFRSRNKHFASYLLYGGLLALSSLIILSPMLIEIKPGSGLKAYSEGWQRNSFLFPLLQSGFDFFTTEASQLARLFIAGLVGSLALFTGLRRHKSYFNDLFMMMFIIVLFFLLSPTGFPWYVIWFVLFLPFVPSYGVGLLSVLVSLYYVRFWFGERDLYAIYLDWIVPLQFGLPLIIMLIELFRRRRNGCI